MKRFTIHFTPASGIPVVHGCMTEEEHAKLIEWMNDGTDTSKTFEWKSDSVQEETRSMVIAKATVAAGL